MAKILIRSGYDFARKFLAKLDGVVEDLSAATIEASLKNEAKTTELITDTAQANTSPAAWVSGQVVVRFPAASTAGLAAQNAWIEVAIVVSGERFPVDDIPCVIETGYTL